MDWNGESPGIHTRGKQKRNFPESGVTISKKGQEPLHRVRLIFKSISPSLLTSGQMSYIFMTKVLIVSEARIQSAAQITHILKTNFISYSECDRIIRKGIPWESASDIKKELNLTDGELARILDVSERTLSRLRQAKKRLSASTGDRLYRLIRVYSLAREVFEDKEAARDWLHQPQVGLGGRVPLDFIQTEAGAREVEDLLGRMEYGVIS
jgi:putative toxin-antitoxin system antitoxin component (TIGR02293 family)